MVKSQLFIKSFPTGLLGANCVIIGDVETKDAVVVDPGGDADKILDVVKQEHLSLKKIILTHGHVDHISGVGDVRKATGASVVIHEQDKDLYDKLELQCRMFGLPFEDQGGIDDCFKEGDKFTFGSVSMSVLHTPGHSPGSCCFYIENEVLLSGDTLFRLGVGRTDLWGGSTSTLRNSIKQKLFKLPNDLRVICGHGEDTTIGFEKSRNPLI